MSHTLINLTLIPVGVAAPARRLTFLGVASLSDSSPDELDISFMYPLSILLALS